MQAAEVGASDGTCRAAGGTHQAVGDEGRLVVNAAVHHDGRVAVRQAGFLLQDAGSTGVDDEGRAHVAGVDGFGKAQHSVVGQAGLSDARGTVHDAVVRRGAVTQHGHLEGLGDGSADVEAQATLQVFAGLVEELLAQVDESGEALRGQRSLADGRGHVVGNGILGLESKGDGAHGRNLGVAHQAVVEVGAGTLQHGEVVEGFDDRQHVFTHHFQATIVGVGAEVVASGQHAVKGTAFGSGGLHQDGRTVHTELKAAALGHFANFVGIGTLELAAVHDGADGGKERELLPFVLGHFAGLATLDVVELTLQVAAFGSESFHFAGLLLGKLTLFALADGRKLAQSVVDLLNSTLDV